MGKQPMLSQPLLPRHIGCQHPGSHFRTWTMRCWAQIISCRVSGGCGSWHETRDPSCKTAVNGVTKTIRRMTRKNAIERRETKISNSKFHFSSSLIKHISLLLSNRKLRVMAESELSTPRDKQAGVPQISVLSPTLYSLYIYDAPQTPGVYLVLFADDTCLCIQQIAKWILFSENCSVVSLQWSHDVSAGT
jgi:hypothetical protein